MLGTNIQIENMGISDLTGIEAFIALTNLNCETNQLTNLDLSANTSLTDLDCEENQLTSLDLSANTSLTDLDFSENQITSLDLSSNIALVFLRGYDGQLTSLDLSNGTNILITYGEFGIQNNPNLYCINVDDSTYSANNWTSIDPQHYFSNNCPPSAIQEHTKNKELLKITDLLGRETKQTNQPLFYIYNDGTVENRIVIE